MERAPAHQNRHARPVSDPTRRGTSSHGQRRPGRVPGRGTADPPVGFVLARVPGHLAEGAAGAKDRAAQVLAAAAPLLGDGILVPDALAGLADGVDGPHRKEEAPHRLQYRDRDGEGVRGEFQGGELEGVGKDRVRHKERDHHREGVLGRDPRAGFAEPGQGHPGHDLRQRDLVAPHRAAEGGVAGPGGTAVEEAVLPPAGRGPDALVSRQRGEGDPEALSLGDAALRHFASKRASLVVVYVCFKGVASGKGRRSDHADLERQNVFATAVFVSFVSHDGGGD
mmetsp:Transcript_25647/g.54783  ORF Transcript_25647/g.54783 Transcript_25647/m.54783 type:complete len:282 (-) Transcript_25647:111-956(-)